MPFLFESIKRLKFTKEQIAASEKNISMRKPSIIQKRSFFTASKNNTSN
jgi:hypothetical protein